MPGDIQQLYEKHIRLFGSEVTTRSTTETALKACQHTFYPLIVVDLDLPEMNSLELCRRIRSLPQGDRSMILVITGHDEPKYLQAALDAGADDYLTKPVSMEMLHVRLTILTQQFRNRVQRKQNISDTEVNQQSLTLQEAVDAFEKQFITGTRTTSLAQKSNCSGIRYRTQNPLSKNETIRSPVISGSDLP